MAAKHISTLYIYLIHVCLIFIIYYYYQVQMFCLTHVLIDVQCQIGLHNISKNESS